MMRSNRLMFAAVGLLLAGLASPVAAQEDEVVRELNRSSEIDVTESSKSYKVLFDAALRLSDAPSQSGGAEPGFNLSTIYPGMSNWTEVSDWAEANPHMAEAILEAHQRTVIGLPYGEDIDTKYFTNGMYADIAIEGDLHRQDFAYLEVMDTISAFAVAETYRLFEANQTQRAIDLAIAHIYVLDQLAERVFLQEKLHAINQLTRTLGVLRNQMYSYFDQISLQQFAARDYVGDDGEDRKGIAFELPWLRVDLLLMPTGDRVVAEAMIESAFDGNEADPEKFADIFAKIQSEGKPFTRFGAVERWKRVAAFHASRDATLEHLEVVYDDWWRRWGVRAWSIVLDLDTQYERTNPVRYAAVTYALRDLEEIFGARRRLSAAVNGTVVSAGLCGYRKQFGTYPDDLEKIYATFVQKRFDLDPYNKDEAGFGYRYIGSSPIEIYANPVEGVENFVEVTGCLLWSQGTDYETNRGTQHDPTGQRPEYDIVYWPPIRALAREQGLISQ